MDRQSRKAKLDNRIQELERTLTSLKGIRAAMDDDQLDSELAALFGENGRRTKPSTPGRKQGGSVLDKLTRFFGERNNAWATIEDIKAAGIKVSSARQVLYRTQRDQFDRQSYTGGGKPSRFRCKVGPEAVHEKLDANGEVITENAQQG